tara:strand:+ start:549 stop:1256 length:708 start_codon:yes stop_codon:yes gene_type:complete
LSYGTFLSLDKSKKILVFDTSANACSAALWANGEVACSCFQVMSRGHSEALVPMIEEVFEKYDACDIDVGGLSAIAVTIGPGAFTGIRIGLATARALALPRRLPVIGLTNFDVVFWQAPKVKGLTLVVLETKREDFYVQVFSENKEAVQGPMALTAEEIQTRLPVEAITLVGDGAERLDQELVESGRKPSRLFSDVKPVATEFAELASKRLDSGIYADPEPLYLRAPSVTSSARK